MTHLSEEDLVLAYYGEIAAPAHLKECPQCRASALALANSLEALNEWTAPAAPAEFERSVWAAIAPELEPRRRIKWRWPVWTAAFAALLLVGFVLGRITTKPAQPRIMAGLSQQARDRILRISLADHLDRAGMLLTEISNASDVGAFERDRAQDLVDEGRLMRQLLTARDQTGTVALMDELERFLLEVANTDASPKELQDRIAAGSLLFKVRIIESNIRSGGTRI